MRTINWNLIRKLPADAAIVTGSPEYGCFRCAHIPAKRYNVEMLLAETGEGIVRRLLEPRKGLPSKWGQAHLIAGQLEDFRVPTCEESPLRPLDLENRQVWSW